MAEKKLVIRMDAETARLQAGMARASASTRSFGKSIEQGITRHAAGIRMTGMAIAGLGAAITGMVVLSVKSAMEFEAELANVSTMLDETSMHLMPAYEEGLDRMTKAFGESSDTLSKGLYDILSASIAPTKALEVLEVAARAAVAGITNTGIAADAITTVINAYGLAASDAADVSDWLFAVVKRGKTDFAALAPAIGKVATVAHMAGVNMEELGAMVATLTRSGVETNRAMTAVLGVLRTFLKATDESAETAEVFGVAMNTATLRTEGLRGVMLKLIDAESEQLAQIFPNIRALLGFSATIGDATGFAEDYEFILNRAGKTQEAFAKQSDTLAFAFGQLKEEFMDLFEDIGLSLIPIIKSEFIPLMKDVIEYLKGWVEQFKALSPEMKKFAMELGPILIALGGMIALLPTVTRMVAALGTTFGATTVAIGGGIGTLAYLWIKWEKTWAKYAGSVAGAVLPIIKLIEGTGGIIPALKKMVAYNEFAGRVIVGAWMAIGKNMMNWATWIATNVPNVFKKLIPGVEAVFTEMPETVGIGMEEAREILDTKLAEIDASVEKTTEGIEKSFEKMTATIKGFAEAGAEAAATFELAPWQAISIVVENFRKKMELLTLTTEIHGDEMRNKWVPIMLDAEGAATLGAGAITELTVMVNKSTKAFAGMGAEGKVVVNWLDVIKSDIDDLRETMKLLTLATEVHEKEMRRKWVPTLLDGSAAAGLGAEAIGELTIMVNKATKALAGAEAEGKVAIDWLDVIKSRVEDFREEMELLSLATEVHRDEMKNKWIPMLDTTGLKIDTLRKKMALLTLATEVHEEEMRRKWTPQLVKMTAAAGLGASAMGKLTTMIHRVTGAAGLGAEAATTWSWNWRQTWREIDDASIEQWNKMKGYLGDYVIETEKKTNALTQIWEGFTSSVKSSFSDFFYDIISGTRDLDDAWTALANSIKEKFIRALADSLAEKMGWDKIFEGNILSIGNLFTGLANTITGTFAGIGKVIASIFGGGGEAAAGGLGGLTGVIASLTSAISTAATVFGTLYVAMEGIKYAAENIVGPALSGIREGITDLLGIEEASVGGIQTMEEFAESFEIVGTRMEEAMQKGGETIDWLIEKGRQYTDEQMFQADISKMTFEEVYDYIQDQAAEAMDMMSESQRENFERTLVGLDKQKKKYDIAYDAMLENAKSLAAGRYEIEGQTTAQLIEFYAQAIAANENMTDIQKRNILEVLGITEDAADDMMQAMRESTRDMALSMDRATDEMTEAMNEIPRRIDFGVFGEIHMPDIPDIPDQSFRISGTWSIPDRPRPWENFQHGGQIEPGELVFSKPITDWIRAALSGGNRSMGYTPSRGQAGAAGPARNIIVNVPRGAFVVYGDIRTEADVEELTTKTADRMAESIAARVAEAD